MGAPEPVVAIVGAGAAGLAAARELADRGVPCTVIEARPRPFGRVDTLTPAGWPLPVERGAELVHHEAADTEDLARRAGVRLDTIPEEHYWLENGRAVRTPDMEALVQEAVAREKRRRADRSLADVLAGVAPPKRRRLQPAAFFVEGYHAAALDEISAKSLAGDAADSIQRRPRAGTAPLLAELMRGLPPVRLGTTVTEIAWRRHRVRLTCRSTIDRAPLPPVVARACVVTVPLGVLLAGRPDFRPRPAAWGRALARLHVGAVEKLVLLFREAFWHEAPVWRGRARVPAFWHARDVAFRTWWTRAPLETPVLTAWAGGPAADALRGRTPAQLVEAAVNSLAAMLGVSRATIEDHLADVQHHDWNDDPFSRGAYAYVGVGGGTAQETLGRVVEGTVVLAGEALDEGIGTVEGALRSGRQAARALLRTAALSAGRRSTTSGARRSVTSLRR